MDAARVQAAHRDARACPPIGSIRQAVNECRKRRIVAGRAPPRCPDLHTAQSAPGSLLNRRGRLAREVVEMGGWRRKADQQTRSGGPSPARGRCSAISARRVTAFSRRAAASRAMAASSACPTRGARRSSATMSSWSLSATSAELTANAQRPCAPHGAGSCSRSRRTVRSANSCWRQDASRSS